MPTLRDWFRDPYIGLGSSPGAPPEATIGQAMRPYAQDLLAAGRAAFGPQFLSGIIGPSLPVSDDELLGMVGPHAGLVGILPERARFAREVIRRGVKQPLFHGTPEPALVLREGFSPAHIGRSTAPQLGEPAGISLTTNVNSAQQFGIPLRVVADVPPSTVLDLLDPQARELFRQAFTSATEHPAVVDYYGGRLPFGPNPERDALINQAMTDWLRDQGVEALRYNPSRYNEFELRVLDPSKAHPVGRVPREAPDLAEFDRRIDRMQSALALERERLAQAVREQRSPAAIAERQDTVAALQAALDQNIYAARAAERSPHAYDALQRWREQRWPEWMRQKARGRLAPAHLRDIIGDLRAAFVGGSP